MCIGGGGGGGGGTPQPDTSQQESQIEQEQTKKKKAKQEALSETIAMKKGGKGRRSLISGTGGGMGYYSEYL